ncbi:hypothetical protein BGX20_008531 [Mortierella sp. AD010]|nr:hypothetical protein BGX20_008531 [Mortierella sp. AD010]
METQLYRSEGPACMSQGGMIIGGCPTAPGKGAIQTSFNISQSAPYAELQVTLQIVGSNNQTIACMAVLLEQDMPTVNTAISYLPLALAVLSGGISLTATFMRASVGSGFLGAAAAYGLPNDAISVHTPGLFDIVFYTQFMLMTGQLSVNYPSFYSTFTALFHWSFLQFSDTLMGKGPANASEVLLYGGSGSVNQIKSSEYTMGGNGTNSTQAAATELQKRWNVLQVNSGSLPNHASLPDIGTKQAASMILRSTYTTTPIPSSTVHWIKRQVPSVSGSVTTAVATSTSTSSSSSHSNSPIPSSPVSPSPFPSPSPTASDSEESPTSRRTKTSHSDVKPTSSSTRTESSIRLTTSTTTASLIIPTIRDPFDNRSANSVHYNISRFGIESYAAAIGAFPSELFLGTLVNSALAAGLSLVISGVFLGVAWIMAKENHQRGKTLQHALNFVAGNLVRVWLLVFTPLALSAMYQLTISTSAGLTVASAASLIIISVSMTIFFTWRILRASSELLLYDDQATLLKYGTLYNTLAQEGTLFFLVTLLVRFLWGLAIAMLSSFEVAQVAVLIAIELGYVLIIGFKWPYAESGDNKFHLFLGIIRVVITGCLIAYIHSMNVPSDHRQLVAYIQMSLHLAVFIVIFALILWNFIQVCMFWKLRHSDAWKGPTKTYSFEDPAEQVEQGWGLPGRPNSRGAGGHMRGIATHRHDGEDEDGGEFVPAKGRRFTVASYASLGSSSQDGNRGSIMQHAHHAPTAYNQMLHHGSTDDDTLRYGSPAERYRQSRLSELQGSRFSQSAVSDGGSATDDAIAERRPDSMKPLVGPTIATIPSSTTSGSLQTPSIDVDGSIKSSFHGPSPLGTRREHSPQKESYANFQRMKHQHSMPDPRTRRMSDITRDGPYLYDPRKDEQDNTQSTSPVVADLSRKSLFAGLVASLGTAFRFGRRSGNTSSGDGSKPKAFEVMRPPRRNYVPEPSSGSMDETGSQAGGDQLRELHSLGISRFFQESDRGYEANRSLFVANPSAMISRTGSLVSTVSGAVPAATTRLNRNGSGTAESIRTLNCTRSKGVGVGSGLSTSITGSAFGVGSGQSITGDRTSIVAASGVVGNDSSIYERGSANSALDLELRRTPAAVTGGSSGGAGNQLYHSRHSADSSNNIADALTIDAPLLLQGGGILRVSKGPEKSVQYWHKESGQYVESIAESLKDEKLKESKAEGESSEATSSLPPAIPPIQTLQQQSQQKKQQEISSPSVRSRSSIIGGAGTSSGPNSSVPTSSSPGSPTESQDSPTTANVAASAGRMHEILGRMFSDKSVRLHSDHEPDSDSILSEDTTSTFSGNMSIMQQAQSHLGRDDVGTRFSEDTQSIERYDMLEPVPEDSDSEPEQDLERTSQQSNIPLAGAAGTAETASAQVKRASSSISERRLSGPPLMRTFSGPLRSSVATTNISGGLRSGLLKSRQNSLSNRPLAQTPLHSPSVQLGSSSGAGGIYPSPPSSSSLHPFGGTGAGDLNRQSSLVSGTSSKLDYLDTAWSDTSNGSSALNRNPSTATARTETSYVTAMSEYPSDEEGM